MGTLGKERDLDFAFLNNYSEYEVERQIISFVSTSNCCLRLLSASIGEETHPFTKKTLFSVFVSQPA